MPPGPFRIKSYKQGRENLVAACDEDVLGRKLQEGKLRLHVNPDFYDGFAGDEEALVAFLVKCTVANLVGEKTIDVAVRLGLISPENVLRVEGVPHAQWALLI